MSRTSRTADRAGQEPAGHHDLTVKQVAFESGHRNPDWFITRSDIRGITPGEYRRRVRLAGPIPSFSWMDIAYLGRSCNTRVARDKVAFGDRRDSASGLTLLRERLAYPTAAVSGRSLIRFSQRRSDAYRTLVAAILGLVVVASPAWRTTSSRLLGVALRTSWAEWTIPRPSPTRHRI